MGRTYGRKCDADAAVMTVGFHAFCVALRVGSPLRSARNDEGG